MGVEDRVGLAATEDIADVEGPVDMVDTVEVEDQVGIGGIMVATEGIMVGMVGIMVVMVGSFPGYLSAVS